MERDAPTISEDHLECLAKIAHVPHEKRQLFNERIQNVIAGAHRIGKDKVAGPVIQMETVQELCRVHTAAQELRSALDALGGHAAGWIEALAPDTFDEECHIADYRDEVSRLVEGFGRAEAMAKSLLPRRGRPSQEPGDPGFNALDSLLYGIVHAVSAADGRLTFDKNHGKGTIVKFIECLKPFLPSGLLPNVLPPTRMARAVQWTKKSSEKS